MSWQLVDDPNFEECDESEDDDEVEAEAGPCDIGMNC